MPPEENNVFFENILGLLNTGIELCREGSESENMEIYKSGIDKVAEAMDLAMEGAISTDSKIKVLSYGAVVVHKSRHIKRRKYVDELIRYLPGHPDVLFCKAKDYIDDGDLFAAYRALALAFFTYQGAINENKDLAKSLLVNENNIMELRLALEHAINESAQKETPLRKQLLVSDYLKTISPYRQKAAAEPQKEAAPTDPTENLIEEPTPQAIEQAPEIDLQLDEVEISEPETESVPPIETGEPTETPKKRSKRTGKENTI